MLWFGEWLGGLEGVVLDCGKDGLKVSFASSTYDLGVRSDAEFGLD